MLYLYLRKVAQKGGKGVKSDGRLLRVSRLGRVGHRSEEPPEKELGKVAVTDMGQLIAVKPKNS